MNYLDGTFSALADPTRRQIVTQLAEGPQTVNEIANSLPISQPAVSKHLKILEIAGLITREQIGTKRPARLAPEAFVALDHWLERYRQIFEANFQRLDILLDELQKDPDNAPDDDNAH
ncbi:MAG: metalloregulator ArsR/SmtB family transcription factor [Pseudomonadota bacterium]